MTPDEYQAKVQTFIQYNHCFSVDYPSMGLVAETGEIYGKLAKLMRDEAQSHDDFRRLLQTQEVRAKLLTELGDCYWMLSALATAARVDFGAMPQGWEWSPGKGVRLKARRLVCSATEIERNGPNESRIACALMYAYDLAQELGSDLESVFDQNIAKLESRRSRGVLGGSGDDR